MTLSAIYIIYFGLRCVFIQSRPKYWLSDPRRPNIIVKTRRKCDSTVYNIFVFVSSAQKWGVNELCRIQEGNIRAYAYKWETRRS
jgi:hypothetical protein